MAVRKEDEIMAEYLLKGGKMLEKTCKICGCPLFEVKGTKLCVVCEERGTAAPASADAPTHKEHGYSCDGGLVDELAMTIFSLCERIQNEKDPENVLLLMNAVKTGTETLVLVKM